MALSMPPIPEAADGMADKLVDAFMGTTNAAYDDYLDAAGGWGPINAEEGFQVQRLVIDKTCKKMGLDHPLGWKIGGCKKAQQEALGLSECWCGAVFRVVQSPAKTSSDNVRGIECEFVLKLKHDLPSRGEQGDVYSMEQVTDAVGAIIPAYEVVRPRVPEQTLFKTTPAPFVIADYGGCGEIVLGEASPPSPTTPLFDTPVPVSLSVNNVTVASGTSAEVLGNPLTALHWLVNFLSPRGVSLYGGQVISTGTTTGMTPVAAGDKADGSFDGFGKVEIQF
ncbi:unnamed protein product [Vitrella brassicaformis CCMP3155]|uniref:Fumarylacetoacetase-like C-terminal domain-containing protein n=1 Tax=Vitrella brassicaformis (strain CCMP3155) TaxID=1169540 RepID=A0A0G4EV74_VITBC|nr:unnamed protein product [Vitrella brassicaformis CCMP3155]|mmetsp:Transcript_48729/g.122035  ORF Transcript_48729/g.122035 Transcript_48729/m.122035 type:complete len:280 (-) Transcript_48729:774-1613(-)|eukprot:CEM02521.1 unnamed protein product [Vitrella brassicaformis CCMP3155]